MMADYSTQKRLSKNINDLYALKFTKDNTEFKMSLNSIKTNK